MFFLPRYFQPSVQPRNQNVYTPRVCKTYDISLPILTRFFVPKITAHHLWIHPLFLLNRAPFYCSRKQRRHAVVDPWQEKKEKERKRTAFNSSQFPIGPPLESFMRSLSSRFDTRGKKKREEGGDGMRWVNQRENHARRDGERKRRGGSREERGRGL